MTLISSKEQYGRVATLTTNDTPFPSLARPGRRAAHRLWMGVYSVTALAPYGRMMLRIVDDANTPPTRRQALENT